jgi:tetratricopeptide (TPR) repeat protein
MLITFSVAGITLLPCGAWAYTSSDYYNAGLQLYNAKNYQQAAQYFGAAISLDPNNAAALQGQANSYYALGQYPQALDDYQKVQALQPSHPLASMIQALQAKVGAAAPAVPSASGPGVAPFPGSTAGSSFAQGVALFQQQQYAQAVPLFQKAVQETPGDSKAYYYLGVAQVMSGDMKDAAVALGLSNKLNPNPSVAAYVDRVKARLSPEDQQWVDNQVSSGNAGGNPSASASNPKTFGIRLEPALLLLNMADFNTNAESLTNEAKQLQGTDPTISYEGVVPTGAPQIGIEPVIRLSDNLEMGIPLAFGLIGNVTDKLSGSNFNGTDSYAISAFSVGGNLRYLIGKGSFQPFICAGFLVEPISIAYTLNESGSSSPATVFSANLTSVAVGGQISAGLDWHLGDTFVISPFAGFQLASTSSPFTGNATETVNGSTVNSGQAQLEMEPVQNFGNQIILTGNQTPPSGSRPFQMDLSGPVAGIELSAFF